MEKKNNVLYLFGSNTKKNDSGKEVFEEAQQLGLTPREMRKYNQLQQKVEMQSITANQKADKKTRGKLSMIVKELIEFEERHGIVNI